MSLSVFLEIANPAAFLSSALLGLMLGAFYGYYVIPEHVPQRYPVALWVVGVLFVFVLAIVSAMGTDPFVFPLEFGAARALLWTVCCASIPIGRAGRHQFELRRIRFRRRHLKGD